jgi:hypothetical protein
VLVLLPLVAQARPQVRCAGRCRPRATHFIAEIAGGATTYGRGGLALESVFGFGGKLRGFPPRFYLIGELNYHQGATSGTQPLSGADYRDERSFADLGAGLRIYLPIVGPLRLLGDVTLGGSHVAASLRGLDRSPLRAEGWVPMFAVAGGAQLRLFHHASIGARVRAVLSDDDLDALRVVTAREAPTRVTATLGLTWHF